MKRLRRPLWRIGSQDLSAQTEALTITGDAGVDKVTGGEGVDTINGAGGDDIITIGAAGKGGLRM